MRGDGKERLLSGKKFPLPSSMRIPKAPASSVFSKNEIQAAKQSSATIVSGLRNKTISPLAIFNAWLQALPKPTFSLFQIK